VLNKIYFAYRIHNARFISALLAYKFKVLENSRLNRVQDACSQMVVDDAVLRALSR